MMMIIYRMPESLRERLAKPYLYNSSLIFVQGPREYVAFSLRTLLYSSLDTVHVVGDYTCETFLHYIGVPRLCVIDGNIMRSPFNISHITRYFEYVFNCVNPRGSISMDCIKKLQDALSLYKSLVIAKGEEDLLSLALMMYLPAGYIVYGIPKKGVVVVDVSSTKSETINLFSQFSLAILTPSSL
jgi:uncharacterized protein (UPF0218 family)